MGSFPTLAHPSFFPGNGPLPLLFPISPLTCATLARLPEIPLVNQLRASGLLGRSAFCVLLPDFFCLDDFWPSCPLSLSLLSHVPHWLFGLAAKNDDSFLKLKFIMLECALHNPAIPPTIR